MNTKRPESSHDCMDGTAEEDHEYELCGEDDPETGEQMYLECKHCGKEIPYDGRFDGDDLDWP